MKPFSFHDILWDADAIREHREHIIEIRDNALLDGDFSAVLLHSITIGLLYELSRALDKDAQS